MKYYNQINDDDMRKAADAVQHLLAQSDVRLTPSCKNVG